MLTSKQIEYLKRYIKGIVWHWSAGNYYWTSPKYHFGIIYDGKIAHSKQTKSLYEVGGHIWYRNSGLIGISFSAMLTDPKTGKVLCPVEDHQVEVMAKLTAELCFLLDIDPSGVYETDVKRNTGRSLVTTGDKMFAPNITDHAWYAKKDGYANYRWDIGNLEPLVRQKTLWYYSKLKSGEHKFEFTNNLY